MRSKRVWISPDCDIIPGEEGEVIGIADTGYIRVEFTKGIKIIPRDKLITKEAWVSQVNALLKIAVITFYCRS